MAGLPPGWESDYDGSRWFYKYKPTGHIQYHFPSEGDEFPDFIDDTCPAPDLAPEERLESQRQQVRRHTSSGGSGRHGNGDRWKPLMSATARPVSSVWDDGGFDPDSAGGDVFQPESFMFLGPGAYTDVSPLGDEEEEAARRAVAGAGPNPSGDHGKGPSPMGSERTTPMVITSELAGSPLKPTKQEKQEEEEVVYMLDSREMPHEMSGEEPQRYNPVGVVAEMASEQTVLAQVEMHPAPVELGDNIMRVELGDNTMMAPIETALPEGFAELAGPSSPVEAKLTTPPAATRDQTEPERPVESQKSVELEKPVAPAKPVEEEKKENENGLYQPYVPGQTTDEAKQAYFTDEKRPNRSSLQREASLMMGSWARTEKESGPGLSYVPSVLKPARNGQNRSSLQGSLKPTQPQKPLPAQSETSSIPPTQTGAFVFPSILKPGQQLPPVTDNSSVRDASPERKVFVPPEHGQHPPSMTPAPAQQGLRKPDAGPVESSTEQADNRPNNSLATPPPQNQQPVFAIIETGSQGDQGTTNQRASPYPSEVQHPPHSLPTLQQQAPALVSDQLEPRHQTPYPSSPLQQRAPAPAQLEPRHQTPYPPSPLQPRAPAPAPVQPEQRHQTPYPSTPLQQQVPGPIPAQLQPRHQTPYPMTPLQQQAPPPAQPQQRQQTPYPPSPNTAAATPYRGREESSVQRLPYPDSSRERRASLPRGEFGISPPAQIIRPQSAFTSTAEVSPIRSRSTSQSSGLPAQTPSPMETSRRGSSSVSLAQSAGGASYTPSPMSQPTGVGTPPASRGSSRGAPLSAAQGSYFPPADSNRGPPSGIPARLRGASVGQGQDAPKRHSMPASQMANMIQQGSTSHASPGPMQQIYGAGDAPRGLQRTHSWHETPSPSLGPEESLGSPEKVPVSQRQQSPPAPVPGHLLGRIEEHEEPRMSEKAANVLQDVRRSSVPSAPAPSQSSVAEGQNEKSTWTKWFKTSTPSTSQAAQQHQTQSIAPSSGLGPAIPNQPPSGWNGGHAQPGKPIIERPQQDNLNQNMPTQQQGLRRKPTSTSSLPSQLSQLRKTQPQPLVEQTLVPAPLFAQSSPKTFINSASSNSNTRQGEVIGGSQAAAASQPSGRDSKWDKNPAADYSGGDWGDEDDWEY